MSRNSYLKLFSSFDLSLIFKFEISHNCKHKNVCIWIIGTGIKQKIITRFYFDLFQDDSVFCKRINGSYVVLLYNVIRGHGGVVVRVLTSNL